MLENNKSYAADLEKDGKCTNKLIDLSENVCSQKGSGCSFESGILKHLQDLEMKMQALR